MSAEFKAPRGTFDVLPPDVTARGVVFAAAAAAFERAGYGRIETPTFEDTDLFARGVGGSTDIVRKEMFSFEDQGGRSIALRPEGTAPVCRAYLEHGMQTLPQPVKLWYWGSFFRHERPQAGRYRQFNQFGAEVIGSDSPLCDAELIVLLNDLFHDMQVPGVSLKVGSIGSLDSRAEYRRELQAYLREHEADISEDVRERIDENPLRAFDAKDEGTRAVMAKAPTMLERLDGDDAEHFAEVKSLLKRAGVRFSLDPTLVRGLDYYTRTVFAFDCDNLGAQSEIAGGGRYDGLMELLGGPPTPGVGWACGIERLLMAVNAPGGPPRVEVFVVAPEERRDAALGLVFELRRNQLSADLDLAGRSIKGQMKQADRAGADIALILEEDGTAQARDMETGEQREIALDQVVAELGR